MNHHDHDQPASGHQSSGGARGKIALAVFLGIAAFFLLTEHRAHVLGYLPFLLLLACPLLHMFMHGGHGGHAHGSRDEAARGGRNSASGKEG